MKWLGIILPFLIGRFNSKQNAGPSFLSPVAVYEEITYKSRKAVMLTLGALAALIFLCGGLMMSIIDATTQFDRTGGIAFTATFGTGLAIGLLAIGTFAYVFLQAWPGIREHRQQVIKERVEVHTSSSSLEQAFSSLIMDFVKEREYKRQTRRPDYRSEQEWSRKSASQSKPFESEQPNVYHS